MGEEIWEVVERYRNQPKTETAQEKRWVVRFQHGIPVRSLEALL